MKRINVRTARAVPKDSRHIRWNWEISPDEYQQGRYHIVVVDDKGRERILLGIYEQIQKISFVQEVRRVDGKVKNSRLRYLFVSFDSSIAPREIDWSKTGKIVRKNDDLYERVRGDLGDYVAEYYGS